MKRSSGRFLITLSLIAGGAIPAEAADDFELRFTRFVDKMRADPSAPPAFAVVVVHGNRTLLQRVYGVRDSKRGAPLTLDSPMYTSSTTKAYMGLIAAQLDATGELPLTTSLKDVWPGLTLPAPHDPGRIIARSFLSHVSGIEAPALQYRYSDSGEFQGTDVPALLPTEATTANRAYDYGNIGPVIYSSMAEARTGRSWRDLLQQHVVRPLKLLDTSARLEDFAPSEVAHCNTRLQGGWQRVPHKPTALLDAGGGIYSSARDAGKYLRAFTSDGRSAAGAVRPEVLRRTYEPASVQDRQFHGFHRVGYGLGWDLSDYNGHDVVSRSGGYAGCRSLMAFVPKEQFGIVVFTLGDAGANNFNAALTQQAIDFWTKSPEADVGSERRLLTYSNEALAAVKQADAHVTVPANRLAGAAVEYVGSYRREGYGRVAISLHPDGLEARAGVLQLLLAQSAAGVFNAYNASVPGPAAGQITFQRDGAGRVQSLTIADRAFLRERAER